MLANRSREFPARTDPAVAGPEHEARQSHLSWSVSFLPALWRPTLFWAGLLPLPPASKKRDQVSQFAVGKCVDQTLGHERYI